MAIIPLNQKFHTIENSVVTQERGSALVNSQKEIFVTQDIIDTVSAYVGLGGTQYVFVAANGTDLQNAAELQAAYVTAQGMSPSITNRITVIAAPGNYNFSTANFEMNTDYIDLVSLDGNKSIVFNGSNTIEITTNDVFVRGVDVGLLNFTIANSLNLLRVENCTGGVYSFGGSGGGIASGTFTNCTAAVFSFGGGGGIASGVFTNCTGGAYSLGGGDGSIASGTFTNCTGGDRAFGGGSIAIGTFTNCTGGDRAFGGGGGTLSGFLYYCRLTSGTFITVSGGGRTVLCIDGDNNPNSQ